MSGKLSRVNLEKWRKKVLTLAQTKKGRLVWNSISNSPTCLKQVLDSPQQLIKMNVWKKVSIRPKKSQLWLEHFTIPDMIPDTFYCSGPSRKNQNTSLILVSCKNVVPWNGLCHASSNQKRMAVAGKSLIYCPMKMHQMQKIPAAYHS